MLAVPGSSKHKAFPETHPDYIYQQVIIEREKSYET
jgi:hypothetical protein